MPGAGERAAISGRDRELTLLSALMGEGRLASRVLAMIGEPGQGKTTLLNAAIDSAETAGFHVLTASGIEAESELPFAGLQQLVRPVLHLADQLPAPQLAALQAALGMTDAQAPERFLVGLAVLSLLAEASDDRPVLLAIDDAQWLDRGSLDAIAFASRRLHAEPVVVIVTARREFDLAPFGADLQRLELEPLEPADAAALLDASAPGLDRRRRARILDEAAGNPLVLVELARSQARPGAHPLDGSPALAPTARLERLFSGRISSLPPATAQALLVAAASDAAETAAIMGASAELGLPPDAFAAAEHDGLIAIGPESFRFRHPVLRSLVYHGASQAERRAAHHALAAALHANPERAAWHLASVASEPDETIAAALEQAAAKALVRAGYGAASRALRRAAALSPDRGDHARRLVAALTDAFTAGETSVVLDLDRELRELTDDPALLGQAALWVAQVEVLRGAGRGSAALSLPAIQSLLPADPATAIGLLAVAAGASFLKGDRAAADAIGELVGAIPGIGDEAWQLYILAAADPAGNAAAVAPHVADMVADAAADGAMLRVTSHVPFYLDDHAAAATLLARCVDVTRREGGMGAIASYIVPLALTEVWHGRLSDAVMHATDGVRIALETDQPTQAAVGLATEALVAAIRGDADVLHDRATRAERTSGVALARAIATWAVGLDALSGGHPDVACRHLQRLFAPGDPAAHREVARWAIADLAEAAVGAGDAEGIAPLIDDAERLAVVSGATRATLVARRARAIIADGPSTGAWEAALAVRGAALWPFEHARSQLSYGSWLRRHRHIVAAREPLRAAADTFERVGAEPWAARARTELRAAGEATTTRPRGIDDELTPQQRQVALLAAHGLSNREIGAQLYLSPRTISFHLYNIFPKLGITTRSQLAAAMAGNRPADAPAFGDRA